MKNFVKIVCVLLLSNQSISQVVNTGVTDNFDSVEVGKIFVGGLIDTYYGYDFNEPNNSTRPYFVSSARHNEVNINLAMIDVKYKNNHARAHLAPGFGTYVNDNYLAEKGSLKNLIEANVGVKLSKKKEIWLDAGVLGSPYTNESAISKDHLTYTRSFAPEYVPYYLSGVKLTLPINKKVSTYFYILNGWQQIQDNNNPLSIGTQVEFRPNDNVLFNWNTYVGNEYSVSAPTYRTRYFTDVYVIYKPKGKFSLTSCAYIGIQETKDTLGRTDNLMWWQANVIADYQLKKGSISARVEYFTDPKAAMLTAITTVKGFESYSGSLGYNLKITDNALFRIENRFFYSNKNVFIDKQEKLTNLSNLLIGNLTVWF